MTLNPYLNFPGNTEDAFNFYKSVFGGDFGAVQRFGDMPGPDGKPAPAHLQQKIMHISLPIGKDQVLMGTDAIEEMGFKLATGNNFYICINPDNREEADRLFNGLSAGGKVTNPLKDMFWGAYWGDFTDRFGIRWMVNYQKN